MITMETEEPWIDVIANGEDFTPFIVRWCGPYSEEIAADIAKDIEEEFPFDCRPPGVYRCRLSYDEGQRGPEGQVEIAAGWYVDPLEITLISPPPTGLTK